MVGYKCAEKLVSAAQKESLDLVIFGEEARPAYDRVHLSEFFAGKSANDLSMTDDENWYENNAIRLHLGDPVQLKQAFRHIYSLPFHYL